MRRDFSESAREELLQLVRDVEEEKLSDFTDWIGDRWYDFQSWIGELDIKNYLDNVNVYHKKIIDKNNTSETQINAIFEEVNKVSTDYKSRFEATREDMSLYGELLTQFTDTVDPAKGLFTSQYVGEGLKNAVNDYMERSERLQNIVMKDLPDNNPAFDDSGSYGGAQGSAQNKYKDEDIQVIVRKYYPELSDKEVQKLLKQMNSEGCTYVAVCNTIFKEYVGREDEFEKTFGFPMHKDGDLNYDALIVDYYCSKDTEESVRFDNIELVEERWEAYLKEHDVDVDVVSRLKVTPETYDEIVSGGQLIVSVRPLNLEDEQGNIVDGRDCGHAMTVTGVTEDGRYIVSSWGKVYYVDPKNNYSAIVFQQVRYE